MASATFNRRRLGIALAIVIGLFVCPAACAAPSYKILHNFTGSDGVGPYSGVIVGQNGNLYGTTVGGGVGGCCGTVFELVPQLDGTWMESVLFTFQNNDRDGDVPYGSLIFDAAGNLYGNDTARDAPVGYARRCWPPTTASFQQRVWCLVSRLRMRLTATYWSRGSPAWWLGLCRWLPGNTCLSTHRQTPNRPTSLLSARNSKQTTRASTRPTHPPCLGFSRLLTFQTVAHAPRQWSSRSHRRSAQH
jgi:hypothetical protein